MTEELLQGFFGSIIGQVVTCVGVLLLMLVFAGITKKEYGTNVKATMYSALAIALAVVLSKITLVTMPFGGAVTAFSMFFIVVIGYWFGPVQGIIAGICFGFLSLIDGGYVMHPVQLLLDYPLAFGMLGISGFFRKRKNGLYIGYVVACLGRFVCSFLSGVIFFYMYAPEGWNTIVYSAVYNIAYIGAEMIITLAILSVPVVKEAFDRIRKMALV